MEVVITRDKKSWAEAKITSILRPGRSRIAPLCTNFTRCGGCHFQHVPYQSQLIIKEEIFASIFERFLKEGTRIEPFLPSPISYGYRARARLFPSTDEEGAKVGFYQEGSKNVVALKRCPVLTEDINLVIEMLNDKTNTAFGALAKYIDYVRVENDLFGNSFLTLSFTKRIREELKEKIRALSTHIGARFMIFKKKAQFFWQNELICFYKNPDLAPQGLFCKPGQFFQANLEQNKALVELVVSLVKEEKGETVSEFFCGSGNFSIPLARIGLEIKGFDLDRQAIKKARENALKNQCKKNTQFFTWDLLSKNLTYNSNFKADVVVMDPPRTGARSLSAIMGLIAPKTIIYVSCDPMTLKRDVETLKKQGFKLTALHPLDMFPQTYHIETVAVLRKR